MKYKMQRNWKLHVMTLGALLMAITYASLRMHFNYRYGITTTMQMLDFTALRPFVMRLLLPSLIWPIRHFLAVTPKTIFFVTEALSALLLLSVLYRLFRHWLTIRSAYCASLGFFCLLPCMFVWVYNYYPYFFLYDTPAMLFTALGLLLVCEERWLACLMCMVLATLNRESAILIPFLIPAVYGWQATLEKYYQPFFALLIIYFLLRLGLIYLFINQIGYVMWFVKQLPSGEIVVRAFNNIGWLVHEYGWLKFWQYCALLPVGYIYVKRYVPSALTKLVWVAACYFMGLCLVGNLYEPRILAEIYILLYVPTIIGLIQRFNDYQYSLPHYTGSLKD
ncbi:MAG: hypothetical protein Tsb005_13230 [Gammaproteobacteria bacterium]